MVRSRLVARAPKRGCPGPFDTRRALAKNTHRGRGVGGQPDRGRIEQARLRGVDRGSGQVLEAVSEREVDEPASGSVHRGGHARPPSVASCKRRALQLAAAKSKASGPPTSCTPSGRPRIPRPAGSAKQAKPSSVQRRENTALPVDASPTGASPAADKVRISSPLPRSAGSA